VVGNINEYGLCIGESTFGGVEALSKQEGAVIDYGSLIYITLSRSKTARDAIQTMVALMDEYGYASDGESFSIADASGEVWIMEVIGRGTSYGKMGAVWVARKVPAGYVTAHANQARIQTFPRDDPENCLYAEDVVDVAVHYDLFDKNADPTTFSFSDVFCPMSFNTARLSEARVWSAFSQIADDTGDFQSKHLDYAAGRDLTHRMPLWIKPYKKLSLLDLMGVMNSHYEGTELDSSLDVGAGLYSAPYRPRPLEWSYEGKMYHNERTIGVQQTGWNFVAQIRPHMPAELAAITWFAVDDSSTSPRVPIYGSSRRISKAYFGVGAQDGVMEPLLEFDLTRAFWVQNMVSNFVYPRWADIYPVLRNKIDTIQEAFIEVVANVDKKALEIYHEKGVQESIEHVTKHGVEAGDKMHDIWLKFYGELFVRFRDFFEIVPNENNPDCGCEVKPNGISEPWKKRIVDETGGHYKNADHSHDTEKQQNMEKHLREPVYRDILSLITGYV
jgi:dipeptidase